jgi:hypothetical protein
MRSQPHIEAAMSITLNGIFQFLGFSIATLVATGVLVLGGLNERGLASDGQTFISQTHNNPR